MAIKTIEFNGVKYPRFQATGFAAKFAFPFAKEVCSGVGYDIGCNSVTWALDGSIPIDLTIDDEWDAYNLPHKVNYIFSSHCLEHLDDWVSAIEYWTNMLMDEGVLFLYLPDYSQEYWRPWNNHKHKHILKPNEIKDLLVDLGYTNVYVSGVDLNKSFIIMGERF